MDERTMTLTELATYLQVNPRTIRRWIPLGLPALNIGSKQRPDWRFVWPKVEAWLEERQQSEKETTDD